MANESIKGCKSWRLRQSVASCACVSVCITYLDQWLQPLAVVSTTLVKVSSACKGRACSLIVTH